MYKIGLLGYNCVEWLEQSDDEMLEDFVNIYDIDDSSYISDAIMEHADRNVGIYYDDIYATASKLGDSDYWEEAMSTFSGSEPLYKMLQSAWFYYNEAQLYNNLDALLANIVISNLNTRNEDGEIPDDFMALIEERLDLLDFTACDRFCDLEEMINDLMIDTYSALLNEIKINYWVNDEEHLSEYLDDIVSSNEIYIDEFYYNDQKIPMDTKFISDDFLGFLGLDGVSYDIEDVERGIKYLNEWGILN